MLKRRIREIVNQNLVAISPDRMAGEALRTMRDHAISCLPVIDRGRAVGMLTERSLVAAMAEMGEDFASREVRQIMTSPVIQATDNTRIYEAYNLLSSRRLRHLLITDLQGRPQGVLSLTDIIDNMGMEYFLDSGNVAQVMSKAVITVDPSDNLRTCMRLMAEGMISCLVVVEKNLPVGMFTERDATRLKAGGTPLDHPVGGAMSRPVRSVALKNHIALALQAMQTHNIRRLAVLDDEGRLRGIITQSDIVRALETKYVAMLKGIIKINEERYRTLFEHAAEGIFQTTPDGRVLALNPSMARMLGYDDPAQALAEVTDLAAQHYMHPERRARVIEELDARGGSARFESEFKSRTGESVWLSYTMRTVKDEDGHIRFFEGICTDITDRMRIRENNTRIRQELAARVEERTRELTEANSRLLKEIAERKKAEEDARQASARAEAASRTKSAFLANMSHEIRTPIANIVGMTDFMLASEICRDYVDKLGVVRESAESLLSIVSDILDLSKIEAGKLEFTARDFCPAKLLDKVATAFKVRARELGLDLLLDADPSVPALVRGDPDRMEQVLVNLVGNALKFTGQGSISISVSRTEEAGTLHFSVADTGIGIPRDKQGIIFDTFTQADSSLSKRFPGTGLGLAVSRELVGLMHGEIWVDSEPGRGSTFHFTARFDEPAGDAAPEPLREDAEANNIQGTGPLHVLLAEDNEVNQTFLSMFLEEAGHSCVVVENGLEALRAMEKDRFDLIVMDVQMPEMDGVAATREIRTQARGANPMDIPIIALTAYSMKGDRERFLAAGMNEYLAKPVDMDELTAAINRTMRAQGRKPER